MTATTVDTTFDHIFRREAGRILESKRTRSFILSGNVQDLFYLPPQEGGDIEHPHGQFTNLIDYLCGRWGPKAPNTMLVVYELNGPIRFINQADRERMKSAWPLADTLTEDPETGLQALLKNVAGLTGKPIKQPPIHSFDVQMSQAIGRPSVALQMLRKFCDLSRNATPASPLFTKKLLILVE